MKIEKLRNIHIPIELRKIPKPFPTEPKPPYQTETKTFEPESKQNYKRNGTYINFYTGI